MHPHRNNIALDTLARAFHQAYGAASRRLNWGGPGWQDWDVLPEAARTATREGVLALLAALEE